MATLCYIIFCKDAYMGVSFNGGTPKLHPKMIIFSRKTHRFVGETHHFHGFVGETHHFRKPPIRFTFFVRSCQSGDPMRLQKSPTYERLVRFLAGFFGVEPIRWGCLRISRLKSWFIDVFLESIHITYCMYVCM